MTDQADLLEQLARQVASLSSRLGEYERDALRARVSPASPGRAGALEGMLVGGAGVGPYSEQAIIAANAITASEIAANAITASEIAAGAITAEKLLVGGGRYLTNPDFETGDISGWTYGNSGGGGSYGVGNDPAWRAQGAFYAVITTTTTGYAELWQVVNGIRYGDYIHVSALVANSTGRFMAVWRNSAGADISTTPSAGFPNTGGYGTTGPTRQSAKLGPAPAGTASVRLVIASTSVNGALLIDDVWFSRVGDLITPDGNVVIDASGVTITNGELVVTNPSSTVIIDGTSNMFKIAATGTTTLTGGAAPDTTTSTVTLTALGALATTPAFTAFISTSASPGPTSPMHPNPHVGFASDGLSLETFTRVTTALNGSSEATVVFTLFTFVGTTIRRWTRYYVLKEAAL